MDDSSQFRQWFEYAQDDLSWTKTDESFEELREECSTLNSYYAPTRYPDIGEFMNFNQENAKEAYSFAENIVKFIEKKLSAI